MLYVVWRHGGAFDHRWRVVVATPNADTAERRYATTAGELRQGTVRLVAYEAGADHADPGAGRIITSAGRSTP